MADSDAMQGDFDWLGPRTRLEGDIGGEGLVSYHDWRAGMPPSPLGQPSIGLVLGNGEGSAHDLKIRFRRWRPFANDANLLYQLQRPVQISVSDCICRENCEFCYFATISLREAFLGFRQ